jgi:hypothetical protein
MSAFDNYLKTKPASNTLSTGSTVTPKASPFDVAIQNSEQGTPFDAAIKNKPTATGNTLRWMGKQLMKPVGLAATLSENIGNAIGDGDVSYLKNLPGDLWQVAIGDKENSYTNILQKHLPNNPKTALGVGLALDIAGDPLNLFGGGLTKVGKLASLVNKLDKAGTVIAEGSKLMKDIEKAGTTLEALRKIGLGATKAEQAALGQRSALQFMKRPIISAGASEKFYKGTQAITDVAKAIPVGVKTLETGEKAAMRIGDVVEKGRGLFNTSTGNAAADAVFQKAKNAGEYGIAKIMEKSKALYASISKLPAEDLIQVSNFLEKEAIPSNPALLKVGEELKATYKQFSTLEKELGLLEGELSHYAPHIPVREKTSLVEKAKNVFGAREWSTKLGHAENRDVVKFVSEKGKEVIGTAKSAGMQRVDKVKGLTHDLNWGQFKSIQDISQTLKDWGYNLVFKPQESLRGKAFGYFSPKAKELVIASKRPTLAQVMSTVFHEIVHSAHFQLAGNIDMLETFTKGGKYMEIKKLLDGAKEVVKKDWVKILEARGITPEVFAKLPAAERTYLKEPTELLARVAQTYIENPLKAKTMFPDSVAQLEKLRAGNPLFDILGTKIPELGEKVVGDVFKDKFGELFQVARGKEGLSVAEHNINAAKNKLPFKFEENPAVQLAYRGISHVKATTAKQLFEDMKQFAVDFATADGVAVSAPELAGLKFEPGVAKQIDAVYKSIQPEEINKILKGFDTVQNYWKAQALISPAYHLRNMVGNFWNNHLAGVSTKDYLDATKIQTRRPFELVDAVGKKWTGEEIIDQAERSGVIGQGWFNKDITEEVLGSIKPGSYNPLSQNNKLFRANKYIGSKVENNARLANFVSQIKKGVPVDDAAMEVKKFLFDYSDLTSFEKNVLKRIMPFYTFTRKNVPLQLDQLLKQPGKFANLEKGVRAIESFGMGDSTPANEKYLSDYIKNNTAMRVNYNPDDKSYNYFLLGNWLPAYQAMDFIAQPTENLIGMISPLMKTPFEINFNKSSFWKNTLDEAQDIERYPGEQVNFLGMNITKKTATILKNIRILSDLDKLNPGLIFGGKRGQESIWSKAGLPAVNVPLAGNVSPSKFKYSPTGNNPTGWERVFGFTSGKLTSYKPAQAREYYNQDTDAQVVGFKTAIKAAQKAGDKERARLLTRQMVEFQKTRGR